VCYQSGPTKKEQKWQELAEETALTKRQIEMWELFVKYDMDLQDIAAEYEIEQATVSKHVERARAKVDQSKEKIEELQNELEQWKKTRIYANV
jgi:predicted DNA-binding protein YlxM (UPF0122 family)